MNLRNRKGCGCVIWGGLTSGVIAAILSWLVNGSIGWALLHFVAGIFYIIWWCIVHLPVHLADYVAYVTSLF
ncbi:MAG: hypothetical protein FWE40_05005 [Oscillospiraceae bacterium]|nr:hypothetical protein [Oscillospiraceae bacterium]